MEVEARRKACIHRGSFKAPDILADDPDYANILNQATAADQSPFANGGVDATELHAGAVFEPNKDAALFWQQQRLPAGFLVEHQQKQEEENDCVPMDTGEEEQDDDDDLRDHDDSKTKYRNVYQVFHETRMRVGTRARLGETTAASDEVVGKVFRLRFPDGLAGKYVTSKIPNMALMIQSGERTMQRDAEGLVASSQMLCPPVHVSPLFMALNRDFQPCQTITDAITSIMRLSIVRLLLMHTDTSDPVHKDRANKYRRTLVHELSSVYYGKVEDIIAEGSKPVAEREEKDARKFYANLTARFGLESDRFAMGLIHAVEWNILDILHIPYAMRCGLMTPDLTGERVDPRTYMNKVSFEILRANLCNYTRNRNEVFCMKYEVDTSTGRYKTTKIIDPDAWQPMHLDEPRLEDRLALLETYHRDNPVPNADRIMFGLYHNWISLHTLREFLMFLSTDTRTKPKKLRPTAALHQEMDKEAQEQEQQQQQDEK